MRDHLTEFAFYFGLFILFKVLDAPTWAAVGFAALLMSVWQAEINALTH